MKKQKFHNPPEVTAAGYYFGASILGTPFPEKDILRAVGNKEEPDWPTFISCIRNHLGIHCEGSDEMFDGMMDECKDWVKQASKNDKYVVGEWQKLTTKWGLKTSIQ